MRTHLKIACTTLLLLAAATTAAAQATTWQIDPGHSSAQFSVRHMMVSTVRGSFAKVTGTVQYDPKDASKSVVDATIDTTTISTQNESRDKDLKSPNFF